MSLRERIDYSGSLVIVSGLLLLVPLFDMWEDVTVGNKSVLSTLFENSIFLVLTILLIVLSVWLLQNDWEDQYVQMVARWAIFGTVSVTLIYGWVIGFQLYFQNDLKPYIIAADGVVIGSLLLFIAGVYNAQRRQESAAYERERDRFSALFDNASDVIVSLRFEDGTAVITGVNAPFERTFGSHEQDLIDRPAVEILTDWIVENSDSESEPESTLVSQLHEVIGDPKMETEIRLSTVDGPRDFLVDYVPIEETTHSEDWAEGYLVCTDITPQKERERQFELLSEGTEGLLDARSADDVLDTVRTLGANLIDGAVIGIWEYNPETGTFDPCWITGTGTATAQREALPIVSLLTATEGASQETTGQGSSDDTEIPAVDADELVSTLADRGITIEQTLVRRLEDPYQLVVGWTSPPSTTDRYLLTLLAANTRTALQRAEREEELARRNDQLEFVNSLLRHDIQNSMTIIRARGQALAESQSGQNADYAETIVNESDDVIDLIDRFRALLDALTEGGAETFEPISLSSVLLDKVRTLQATYSEASFTVEAPDDVEVLADEMLGNVLGNVLRNAVEHNDTESPAVEVTVTESTQVVVVRIEDNGPGIPDDKKETIFRRGNRGLKESDIGSGFGLFFVDSMMDRYNGSVTVSDNEPRGAVFELTFPKP